MMNQCDFCGEQCNTTYTYQDDAGNYFIGHKGCMNRLERMDAESKSTRRGAGG